MAVRHCLTGGICEAADKLEEIVWKNSRYNCEECRRKTSASSERREDINHVSICATGKVYPAMYRCPATIPTGQHCERDWHEEHA